MPWDFETEAEVHIDAYEVLEYVRDNKDWFLSELGESKECLQNEAVSILHQVENMIDKYHWVQVHRDESPDHQHEPIVHMYEDLNSIKDLLQTLIKD